ncbi:hypothetical protein OTU49_003656 [Cherax quadricarinatus]|uniref:Uncharacterized protein n=1 Tax=Cherax quadricarinatus TaxID=27406 RepID=A0AAW0XL63_CHEQU
MPEAGSKSLLVQDSTQHKTWITFPTLLYEKLGKTMKISVNSGKMANYTYLLVLVLVVTIVTLLIKNTTLSRELQNGILAHGTAKKALLVDLQNESSRYKATRREVELSRNKLRDLDSKLKDANDDNVKLKSELEDKTKIVEKINEENKDLKAHLEDKKMHLLEAEEKLRTAEEELPKLRKTVRKIQEELQAAKSESQYNLEILKKFQERYTKLVENKGSSAIKQVFKKTQGSKLREDAKKTYRGGTRVALAAKHDDDMRKMNRDTHVEHEGEQHDDIKKTNSETHIEHEGEQHDDIKKTDSETHVEHEGEQHDDIKQTNSETHAEHEGEQDDEDEQKQQQQQEASTPFMRNETVVSRLNTTKTVLSLSQPKKQPQEREDVREKEERAVEEKSKDDPQTVSWPDKRIKTDDEYEYEEEKLENDKVGKNKLSKYSD